MLKTIFTDLGGQEEQGYTEIKQRSLLTSMENYVTVLLEAGRPVYTPSFTYGVLRRFLPEEKVESVKGLALTADQKGVVFDVAVEDLDTFLAEGLNKTKGIRVDLASMETNIVYFDILEGSHITALKLGKIMEEHDILLMPDSSSRTHKRKS